MDLIEDSKNCGQICQHPTCWLHQWHDVVDTQSLDTTPFSWRCTTFTEDLPSQTFVNLLVDNKSFQSDFVNNNKEAIKKLRDVVIQRQQLISKLALSSKRRKETCFPSGGIVDSEKKREPSRSPPPIPPPRNDTITSSLREDRVRCSLSNVDILELSDNEDNLDNDRRNTSEASSRKYFVWKPKQKAKKRIDCTPEKLGGSLKLSSYAEGSPQSCDPLFVRGEVRICPVVPRAKDDFSQHLRAAPAQTSNLPVDITHRRASLEHRDPVLTTAGSGIPGKEGHSENYIESTFSSFKVKIPSPSAVSVDKTTIEEEKRYIPSIYHRTIAPHPPLARGGEALLPAVNLQLPAVHVAKPSHQLLAELLSAMEHRKGQVIKFKTNVTSPSHYRKRTTGVTFFRHFDDKHTESMESSGRARSLERSVQFLSGAGLNTKGRRLTEVEKTTQLVNGFARSSDNAWLLEENSSILAVGGFSLDKLEDHRVSKSSGVVDPRISVMIEAQSNSVENSLYQSVDLEPPLAHHASSGQAKQLFLPWVVDFKIPIQPPPSPVHCVRPSGTTFHTPLSPRKQLAVGVNRTDDTAYHPFANDRITSKEKRTKASSMDTDHEKIELLESLVTSKLQCVGRLQPSKVKEAKAASHKHRTAATLSLANEDNLNNNNDVTTSAIHYQQSIQEQRHQTSALSKDGPRTPPVSAATTSQKDRWPEKAFAQYEEDLWASESDISISADPPSTLSDTSRIDSPVQHI